LYSDCFWVGKQSYKGINLKTDTVDNNKWNLKDKIALIYAVPKVTALAIVEEMAKLGADISLRQGKLNSCCILVYTCIILCNCP